MSKYHNMPHITERSVALIIMVVLALMGGALVYSLTGPVEAQGTYSLDMIFPASGVDSDENMGETFAPCHNQGNCNFSCNAANVGRGCDTLVCSGAGNGDSAYFYTHSYVCNYYPPVCSADSSCAANTCSTSTCSDACGNVYAGTMNCTVSCTATNSCGMSNSGTVVNGVCSASPPADPAGYGNACTSAPNACGDTSSGSIQCDSSCSASTPAAVDQCPVMPGLQCDASACGGVDEPNLTAAYLSPSSATAGSVSLQGRATNNGSADAGSFTSYFEVQGNGTLTWTSAISLGAGSQATVSANRTFAQGSYQVRVCADGAGAVSESNEGDNCSGWAPLTITAAGGGAVTATLSANPTTIELGNSSTLTWSSTNATSCTGVGAGFSTGNATSGTDPVTPGTVGSHTYQVTCTNGSSTDTNSAGITVNPVSGGACTGAGPINVTATPSRVQPGGNSTISWTGSNVASCTLTNLNTGLIVDNSTAAGCSVTDSMPVSNIQAQTTYRLTCQSLTRDVVVNIIPRFEEF